MEVSFSNSIFTNKNRILDTDYIDFFNVRGRRMTFGYPAFLENKINR